MVFLFINEIASREEEASTMVLVSVGTHYILSIIVKLLKYSYTKKNFS